DALIAGDASIMRSVMLQTHASVAPLAGLSAFRLRAAANASPSDPFGNGRFASELIASIGLARGRSGVDLGAGALWQSGLHARFPVVARSWAEAFGMRFALEARAIRFGVPVISTGSSLDLLRASVVSADTMPGSGVSGGKGGPQLAADSSVV